VADVEDDNLGIVHDNGGHISGILLVLAEVDQGGVGPEALVDDSGVLLVTEIEDTNGAVSRD
jgi:hypothetical protein